MRYILVTGANKGIGYAVVEQILDRHPDVGVILGARNPALASQAADQLASTNPSAKDRLLLLTLDVSSDEAVSRALESLREQFGGALPSLYGLVNNAGRGSGTTTEVLEVNVWGLHRLTEALAPQMSLGGRVVNVTSASGPNFVAHSDAPRQAFFAQEAVNWATLVDLMQSCVELETEGWHSLGMHSHSPYGLSKAIANAYTRDCAARYTDLFINACTPGFIETDLGTEFLGDRTPAEAGMKTPTDGARVILSLLFDDVKGSGHYYGSDALRSPMDRYRAPGSPEYEGQ